VQAAQFPLNTGCSISVEYFLILNLQKPISSRAQTTHSGQRLRPASGFTATCSCTDGQFSPFTSFRSKKTPDDLSNSSSFMRRRTLSPRRAHARHNSARTVCKSRLSSDFFQFRDFATLLSPQSKAFARPRFCCVRLESPLGNIPKSGLADAFLMGFLLFT
jgi:hypothetical protein